MVEGNGEEKEGREKERGSNTFIAAPVVRNNVYVWCGVCVCVCMCVCVRACVRVCVLHMQLHVERRTMYNECHLSGYLKGVV